MVGTAAMEGVEGAAAADSASSLRGATSLSLQCRLAAFLCCSCDFGRDPERWSWWGCARHPSRRPWATATQGYMPCSPLHFLEFLLLYAPIFIIAFLQVLPYLGVIETRAGELYAEWVQVKIKPAAMGATTLANAVYLLLPLPAMLLLALRRCSDAVGLPEMPPWQRRASAAGGRRRRKRPCTNR